MSDDLLAAQFERRLIFLVNRDGQQTYIPSRELTVSGLFMSVGADTFGSAGRFGGMGIYYEISAHDSDGMVYFRHFVNSNLKRHETNVEKIKHYMPILQRLMPLQDLADV